MGVQSGDEGAAEATGINVSKPNKHTGFRYFADMSASVLNENQDITLNLLIKASASLLCEGAETQDLRISPKLARFHPHPNPSPSGRGRSEAEGEDVNK